MLSNTAPTANTVVDLEGVTITLQRLLNTATSSARRWDVKASTTDLVFNHPTQHDIQYTQNLLFRSIQFTNSAPAARIYLAANWFANSALSVDHLISDVQRISLEGYANTAYNQRVNILSMLELMQACDIYSVNNGVTNTYTLSIGGITEHPDACRTKSKIFSDGTTKVVFDAMAALTPSYIAFNGINFTGAGLSTSTSNDLGGNTGAVTWTAETGTRQTFYWVGGSGSWDDLSHWSLVSGGTVPVGCLPSGIDNAVFDCNSFADSNGVVTINSYAIAAIRNITWDPAMVSCGKMGKLTGAQLLVNGSADFRGCVSIASPVVMASGSNSATFKTGENTTFTNTITFLQNGDYTITGPLLSTSDIIHNSGGIICNNDSISCRRFDSRTIDISSPLRWLDFTDAKIKVRHTTVNSDNVFYLNIDNFDQDKSTFAGSHIYTENGSIFRIVGTAAVATPKIIDFYDWSGTGSIYIPNYITVNFHDVDVRPVDMATKILYPFTCNNLFLKSGRSYQIFKATGITFTIRGDFITDASNCTFTNITGSGAATVIKKENDPFHIQRAKITNINSIGSTLVVAEGEDGGGNTNVDFDGEVIGADFYWVGGSGSWDDFNHWSLVSGGDPDVTNPENCIPSKYDNVFFDDQSFTANNQQVALGNVNNCKNMTWTREAGEKMPVLYVSATATNALNIYGFLDLAEGMKIQSAVTGGLSIVMYGTSAEENAQYIRFNGFNNTATSDRYFRFTFSGTGGRYDLLDDTPCRIYSNTSATFSIPANVSFYSHGHTILCRNITISGTNTNNNTVDLTGSTIDMDYSFSVTIDAKRTSLAGNTEIILTGSATIANNTGNDLSFHNLQMKSASTISATSSNSARSIIFNKITWAANSTMSGAATIVADTLQYARSSLNTIAGGKKIVVNKKLVASGTPCGVIILQSSNTTPAILSSGNCDMTVSFAKLSNITADISNGCVASNYKLVGRAADQVNIENWTVTDTEGGQLDLFDNDPVLGCTVLPYVQTTTGFGLGDYYVWQYKATAAAPWTSYKSGTRETGADTILITAPGYYKLTVDYGSATCTINDAERHITVIDTIAPVVTGISDVQVAANGAGCTYQVMGSEFDAIVTDDDCVGLNPGIKEQWFTLDGATVQGKTVATTLNGVILNPGITTVTWYASDNPYPVSNEASHSFKVYNTPKIVVNKTDTLVCAKSVVNLNKLVTIGANEQALFYTSKTGFPISSTIITPTETATYYVRFMNTNNQCESVAWDSIRIQVKPVPEVRIVTQRDTGNVCHSLPIRMEVTTNSTEIDWVGWYDSNGHTGSSQYATSWTQQRDVTYTFSNSETGKRIELVASMHDKVCGYLRDTLSFNVLPLATSAGVEIVEQPAGLQDVCEDTVYVVKIKATGPGDLKNMTLSLFDIRATDLTIEDTAVKESSTGTTTDINAAALPSDLAGNGKAWRIGDLTSGDSVLVKVTVRAECGFFGGEGLNFYLDAQSVCSDALPRILRPTGAFNIKQNDENKNTYQVLTEFLTTWGEATTKATNHTGDTIVWRLEATFKDWNQETDPGKESIYVLVPKGLNIVPGSFNPVRNVGSIFTPITTPMGVELTLPVKAGLTAQDTMKAEFRFTVTDAACGQYDFYAEVDYTYQLDCRGKTCDFNSTQGSHDPTLTVERYEFSLADDVYGEIIDDLWYGNVRMKTNTQFYEGDTIYIDFYVDRNNSSSYVPGVDTLVHTHKYVTQNVAQGDYFTDVFDEGIYIEQGKQLFAVVRGSALCENLSFPIATIMGSNTVCRNDTVMYYTAPNMAYYKWGVEKVYVDGTSGATPTRIPLEGSSSAKYTEENIARVIWTTPGSFKIFTQYSVTDGQGHIVDELDKTYLKVHVEDRPEVRLKGKRDTAICIGATINLESMIDLRNNEYALFCTAKDEATLMQSASASPTQATRYYVKVADNTAKCPSAGWDSINVKIHPLPVVTITNHLTEACTGDRVPFTATSVPATVSYLWTVSPDGLLEASGNGDNEYIVWSASGAKEVKVIVTDTNKCQGEIQVTIMIRKRPTPGPAFRIPNNWQ